MSTIKTNNAQIGQSITTTNNFTLYQPATPDGTVRLGNGNAGSVTDLVVLNSSGNLGLGVTPSAWHPNTKGFDINVKGALWAGTAAFGVDVGLYGNAYFSGTGPIYKQSAAASNYQQSSGQHQWFTAPSGTAGNAITFTQAMTLDASGKLGLGVTTANERVTIGSSTLASYIQICDSSTGTTSNDGLFLGSFSGAAELKTKGNTTLSFGTNNTERMRINANGQICIAGTSQRSAGLVNIDINPDVYNGISFYPTKNNGIDACRFLNNSGTIVGTIAANSTATLYNTSSDYRLKENIQPMQNALDVVAQLNPVTYTWKADGSDGQGFIAHELQAVVPDCVTGEKDAVDAEGKPVYQGIDTSFLIATLTKAIQEQQEQINQLKAEVATLKAN